MRTLHVGCPNIGDTDRLYQRIGDALDRRWLTNYGPFVQELEEQIAALLGVGHCVAVCNGTVALEIAIRVLGMRGEVIVPSFTFVATAHALQWQGIKPVFCDVADGTYNIDPARVEELITPNTTGIIGTHVWGKPCEIYQLDSIAHRHKLTLLFDAAHAFRCSYWGQPVGQFGDMEVFSFHATKFFNTFEGGAIVTRHKGLADKARHMCNFGFVDTDVVDYVGTNGKMNEISAAMGLTNLESLDEFVSANRRNYKHYKAELEDLDGVTLIGYNEEEQNNYQYIVLEVFQDRAGICRDDLMYALQKENILARRYFYPGCHRMEPYRSYQPHAGLLLPVTEKLVERVLVLPTGTAIGEREVNRICQVVQDYAQ